MNERAIEIKISCIRHAKTLKDLWIEYCNRSGASPAYPTFRAQISGYIRKLPNNFFEDVQGVVDSWKR